MSENMVANGEHEKISIGRVLVSGSTPQCHVKKSRATQILMSSVVHNVIFMYAVRNVCGVVASGGRATHSTRRSSSSINTEQLLHQLEASNQESGGMARDCHKLCKNHKNGKGLPQTLI